MSDTQTRIDGLTSALTSLGASREEQRVASEALQRILTVRQQTGPMAIDNESLRKIVAEAFGWPLAETLRREYGSPDGAFQGKFFCHRNQESDALSGDRALWIQCVLPQMYAFRRPDIFAMIGGLPNEDWNIGRP